MIGEKIVLRNNSDKILLFNYIELNDNEFHSQVELLPGERKRIFAVTGSLSYNSVEFPIEIVSKVKYQSKAKQAPEQPGIPVMVCKCTTFTNTNSTQHNIFILLCDGSLYETFINSGSTIQLCGLYPSASSENVIITIGNTCSLFNPCSQSPLPTPSQTSVTPSPTPSPTTPCCQDWGLYGGYSGMGTLFEVKYCNQSGYTYVSVQNGTNDIVYCASHVKIQSGNTGYFYQISNCTCNPIPTPTPTYIINNQSFLLQENLFYLLQENLGKIKIENKT